MVDFEKIGDTFEDGFDKVKDFTKKNKVLTIAICGVGAFALYKLYTDKATSQDTEYVSTYAYVPTGYDGYPTMSESVSYDDVVDQLRTETSDINEDFYYETMSDISQLIDDMQYENNKKYEDIIESMNDYDENLTTMSYLEEQRQRQSIIDRMASNSEAWFSASDSEKERLHQENIVLGSILGADFDSASGSWSQDGLSLYNVPIKNYTNTSTANLTNVGITETGVTRNEVIALMKANSEAWHSASETERAKLEAENKLLGKQLGASLDSASGTWVNNDGSALYTVSSSTSKKTSSTSTNVKSSSSSSKKTSSTSSKTSGSKVWEGASSGVVAQMKANSQAWSSASPAGKKLLESQNQSLGAKIGATYDSSSGTWSKDGKKLY